MGLSKKEKQKMKFFVLALLSLASSYKIPKHSRCFGYDATTYRKTNGDADKWAKYCSSVAVITQKFITVDKGESDPGNRSNLKGRLAHFKPARIFAPRQQRRSLMGDCN